MYKAVKQSYACLAKDQADAFLGKGGVAKTMKEAHATCELPRLLEIERNTTGG
jgi:hypothetical protein